jgi:hypothetical protein
MGLDRSAFGFIEKGNNNNKNKRAKALPAIETTIPAREKCKLQIFFKDKSLFYQ